MGAREGRIFLKKLAQILKKGFIGIQISTMEANFPPREELLAQAWRHLDAVAALQRPDDSDPRFAKGSFPGERFNRYWLYRRADDNLFFTALVVFTLGQLAEDFPPERRARYEALRAGALEAYPLYRHPSGRPTYNFWRTRPSRHFPNGLLLGRLDHFRIADDIDDTALVHLTRPFSAAEKRRLRDELLARANGKGRSVRNGLPGLLRLPTFTTWFGQAMYYEQDACALSNLMLWTRREAFAPAPADLATDEFLRRVLWEGHAERSPFRAAHHYPETHLVLYHLSRHFAAAGPQAEAERQHLRQRLWQRWRDQPPGMERLLLANALMRLGQPAPLEPLALRDEPDFGHFYFFVAGMLTAIERPWVYRLARHPFFHIRFANRAYFLTLCVEHLLLAARLRQR